MTDNEIIKALEEIADFDCERCSFNNENCDSEECEKVICRNALDLINRQKAEIERLNENLDIINRQNLRLDNKTRAEAIKEFAERFENELSEVEEFYFEEEHENFMASNKVLAFFNNLVKEMVGDTE